MMNASTVVMNKENYWEKFFELLDPLDADLTGQNGEEYCHYTDEGYDNNLEYYIEKVTRECDNLEEIVIKVMEKVERYWRNYYEDTQVSTLEHKGELIVTVAVVH